MPTQIIVGLLPFLFYSQPHPPKVALVGYGSGVTAGAITQYPIQSLEIVELEAAVYRGARFFENDNHRPLQNPKVTARVGDGRNFLTQRSDKFDVIVSEPSNPWLTGVSNLFTREYFKLVKTRLAEHGIFCQWAQLYEMAPWNIKTILGTVRSEFPYVYVFAAEDWSSDTILIGSLDPLPLDYDVVERAFRDPVTRAEARRGGFQSPHDVFAYLLLGPDELEAFTAGSPDQHRRQRAHRVRGAARSARLRQVRAVSRQRLRPDVAVRPPVRAGARLRRRPRQEQPLRARWRAACWPTASRARRSCGRGARRRPATHPRRGTRACCSSWCRRGSIAIRRSRSRPARSWSRRRCPATWRTSIRS